MFTYYILRNPGHNRVYFDQSQKLSLAELKIACQNLGSNCKNIKTVMVAGIEYISFETVDKLTLGDIKIISRLSFVYALFAFTIKTFA